MSRRRYCPTLRRIGWGLTKDGGQSDRRVNERYVLLSFGDRATSQRPECEIS